jgi:Predicted ribosomal protein
MTRVTFYKNAALEFSGFSIYGHSGFAKYGSDILCASVTSTAQLVINLLNESFGIECNLKIDSKNAAIECLIDITENNLKQKDIIYGILSGYHQHINELCTEYPKNISCAILERNGLS